MYEDVSPGIGVVRVPLSMRAASRAEGSLEVAAGRSGRFLREQGLIRITNTAEGVDGALLVYGEINPCFLP